MCSVLKKDYIYISYNLKNLSVDFTRFQSTVLAGFPREWIDILEAAKYVTSNEKRVVFKAWVGMGIIYVKLG